MNCAMLREATRSHYIITSFNSKNALWLGCGELLTTETKKKVLHNFLRHYKPFIELLTIEIDEVEMSDAEALEQVVPSYKLLKVQEEMGRELKLAHS